MASSPTRPTKRKPAHKRRTTTIKVVQPEPAPFKVVMEMGGETHIAYGDTALEAICQLHPDKISARAIFTLFHDGKQSALSRRAQWTRLTLNQRSVAFYLAKNLVALLK